MDFGSLCFGKVFSLIIWEDWMKWVLAWLLYNVSFGKIVPVQSKFWHITNKLWQITRLAQERATWLGERVKQVQERHILLGYMTWIAPFSSIIQSHKFPLSIFPIVHSLGCSCNFPPDQKTESLSPGLSAGSWRRDPVAVVFLYLCHRSSDDGTVRVYVGCGCVCADTDRSPCEARIYIQPPQALPHNHLSGTVQDSGSPALVSVPVPSALGLLVAVVSSSVKREH